MSAAEGKDTGQNFVAGEKIDRAVPAGRILLELDTGALHLALSLYPNDTEELFAEEQISAVLETFKITKGVLPEEIQWAISHVEIFRENVERVIIAKGQEPVPGRDSFMEYPLIRAMPAKDTDPADPRIFCERRIVNCLKGQEVAIYHPLEEGVAGITLRDMPVPVRPGADVAPKPGRNVRFENNLLYAESDGRLVVEDHVVYVDEELRIQDDLTPANGDVAFVGRILIGGNIEAGVTVHGRKDIDVRGSVIGCDMICEGNLKVGCGIIGSEDTAVRVLGNLEVDFVENANLSVWGNCTIRDNVVTSLLACGGSLNMGQGRGMFISGTAFAREGIEVQSVGIPEGTKARLIVGRNFPAEGRKQEIDAEIKELEAWLEETRELEETCGPTTRAYIKLTGEEREALNTRLEEQRPTVEDKLARAREESSRLDGLTAPTHDACVVVGKEIHADTIIEFPLARAKLANPLSRVTFRFNADELRIETIMTHHA
jgi:uncharacterized protein (DUF342 family)